MIVILFIYLSLALFCLVAGFQVFLVFLVVICDFVWFSES